MKNRVVVLLLAIAASFLFLLSGGPVSAKRQFTKEQDRLIEMGDQHYDLCTSNSKSVVIGGKAQVWGDTAEEKVWNGFKSLGYSDETVAGILGNVENEGAFNPAQHEGRFFSEWLTYDYEHDASRAFGVGLIGFSYGLRVQLWKEIKEKGGDLIRYLEDPMTYSYENGSYYGCNGDCFIRKADSDEDANALYAIEIDFADEAGLKQWIKWGGKYGDYAQKAVDATTPEEAAMYYAASVEQCNGCQPGEAENMERQVAARKYYEKYAGKTSVKPAGGNNSFMDRTGISPSNVGDNVIFVADSIGNEAQAKIKSGIWSMAEFKEVKNSSLTEVENLINELEKSKKMKEILVVSLGNDDPDSITEENLNKVIDAAKSAKTIFFVTSFTGSSENKEKYDAAQKEYVAIKNSKVKLIDWYKETNGEAEKYFGEGEGESKTIGAKPNSDGIDKYVQLLKDGTATGFFVSEKAEDQCDCETEAEGEWQYTTFPDLTDAQLRGLMSIVKNENSGTLDAIRLEASVMANLYDKNYKGADKYNSGGGGGVSGNDVTFIGDSLLDNPEAQKYLKDKLPGLTDADINAKSGRTYGEGLTEARNMVNNSSMKGTLVYELGTNYPLPKQKDIDALVNIVGASTNIVFVTNYTLDLPHGYDDNNTLYRNNAESNPKIYVADFAEAYLANPNSSYFISDKVHHTQEGKNFFTDVMVDALKKLGGARTAPGKNLVDYVVNSGWFHNSKNVYNEAFSDYTAEEMNALKSVFVGGKRTVPEQIVEHVNLMTSVDYITVDGKKIVKSENESEFFNKSNYVPGKTKIHQSFDGTEWVFWTWANPDGEKISDSSGPGLTGDPFGYYEDNPPTSTAKVSAGVSSVVWEDGWIVSGIEGVKKDDATKWAVHDRSIGTQFVTTMPGSTEKGPNKITLHNTEGNGNNGDSLEGLYDGGVAPHFTVDMHDRIIYQHASVYRASGALKSVDNSGGVQIEIIGVTGVKYTNWCDGLDNPCISGGKKWRLNMPGVFTEEEWDYLASLIVAISAETGIPLTTREDFVWGYEEGPRLEGEEYLNYEGIIGHRHTGFGNNHGDPIGIFEEYIKPAIERMAGKMGSGKCGKSSDQDTYGNIEETALKLAWPHDEWVKKTTHQERNTPTEAYKAALEDPLVKDIRNIITHDLGAWDGGSSCDLFVATVMRISGADPNYYCCGVAMQTFYMRAHPELYREIQPSEVKGGDIRNTSSHASMVTTGADGDLYTTDASASSGVGDPQHWLHTGAVSHKENFPSDAHYFRFIGTVAPKV